AGGFGIRLSLIEESDDALGEQRKDERDPGARKREDGKRLLDYGAELVARPERQARKDRVEDGPRDDRGEDRRGAERTVRGGVPADVLRRREPREHDHVHGEIERRRDRIHTKRHGAAKPGERGPSGATR